MKTTICGNYPKIDHKKSKINLRLAINKKDKGRISGEELDRIVDATKKRTVNDQLNCGIDFLTDGQITWTDLLSPYCQALDNVEAGGIRRFFDNNIYYRRPQIVGRMKRNKGIIVDDIESIRSFCTTPVKVVMCGPITFAALSDDFHYKSFENVVDAVSDIIREELLEVEKLGVEYIQLDEPSLPEYPQYFDLAVKALGNIFDGIKTKCGVAFYFTPLKSIADKLNRLPVDFMAVDFVSHPETLDILPPLENIELHAGLIDARDLKLEDKSDVKTKIDSIKKTIKPKEIVLTTSCGLEFLPRNYAMAKMERLSKIAQKI
jgi:5-methyltetrahydropteroyltriglutamate--homocysteine methyltransferase